jgi:hypothetical protein
MRRHRTRPNFPGLDALYPSLEALYIDLHKNPELSLHEEKTAAKMASRLRDLGFEVAEHVGGNGVVGVLRNGEGPTVLVRTELAGLRVLAPDARHAPREVDVLPEQSTHVRVTQFLCAISETDTPGSAHCCTIARRCSCVYRRRDLLRQFRPADADVSLTLVSIYPQVDI